MEIVDDGVGFDPVALLDTGGMGLKNIKDRMDRYGGSVSIDSNFGEGTSVKVTLRDLDDVK